MTKQRLYHSNFNHMGWKKKKGEKSRAHNLRAIAALVKLYMQSVDITEICDPDLIKNNLLYIPDENGKLKIADPKKGDQYFEEITKNWKKKKKNTYQTLRILILIVIKQNCRINEQKQRLH